jgi:hypothetical protein
MTDVEEHVRYQIANAPVRQYPFPHVYVRPVFPEAFYRELIARLPPTAIMKNIAEAGTLKQISDDAGTVKAMAEQPRWITDLATIEEHEEATGNGTLWRDVSEWLLGDPFRELIMRKFSVGITERFRAGTKLGCEVEARLVRDFTNYSIGPHTDTPRKLVSLLFYLPKDESLRHTGTSLFVPVDPAFRCDGSYWHKFKSFRNVATMEFVPNALFAFLKTDRSFHGVEDIQDEDIERNVLLYNIYVNKIAPPAAQRRWWTLGARRRT